jgi:adenylosuccinate synthase
MARFVSLIDLGFGDSGKGLFTDALCRRWPVHTVVRFNGGAQAGHNVVLPDGRHHTFSQFGSGSFVPGVSTLLAAPVVVHPTALLVEEAWLRRAGVHDALTRLVVDARCRITTPFHQAARRLREWLRGDRAHGSCGVGVGETVRHSLQHPEQTLRFADLLRPAQAMVKLSAIRETLAAEFDLDRLRRHEAWAAEARLLASDAVSAAWLAQACALARQVPPAPREALAERLRREGSVLFEGAQGLLLDEWHGFHPHTTWSSVGPAAAEAVLAELGIATPVQHLGILRSYLTRHGPGPLPTEDPALQALPEPHNASDGWQGAFRRGHPDAVLLRYAVEAARSLHGLLISHADALRSPVRLRWCLSYAGQERLPVDDTQDLARQEALTQALWQAAPVYDKAPVRTPEDLYARMEQASGMPVLMSSDGPTHEHVHALSARSLPAH